MSNIGGLPVSRKLTFAYNGVYAIILYSLQYNLPDKYIFDTEAPSWGDGDPLAGSHSIGAARHGAPNCILVVREILSSQLFANMTKTHTSDVSTCLAVEDDHVSTSLFFRH